MVAKKQHSADTYHRISQEISSGNLKPVYYLYGEEQFYLDQLLEKFSNVLPLHEKDFNFDLLYGEEVNPAKVLSIARSFPMMAERRVLIVKNFLQTGKGTVGEGGMNDFIPYLENPNPSCLLVLFDAGKPAGNTKLGKVVSKNPNVGFHGFEPMPDYLIPEWVVSWVSSHHKKKH